MKRFFLIPLLLAALFACDRQAENQLVVMSYNIRNSKAKDGDNAWDIRKDATKEMIATIAPDVFGVQETLPNQMAYIREECPDYKGYAVGRDDGIEKGEQMAIFYKTKYIEMKDCGTWWLSETPDEPSYGWDAACRRTATWALLYDKRNDKHFYCVNTHLDHKGPQARLNGLALVVSKIAGMNPEGYPLILMGDFNVEPMDPCLNALDGLMLSARATALESDDTPSFNGWGNMRATEIDYIYYNGFSACTKFRTVTESFAGRPYISDHYPIVTTLCY